jgi:hypothetical protein
VARTGEERKVYRVLVGKPERKRQLGRPRRGWGDGISMDFTACKRTLEVPQGRKDKILIFSSISYFSRGLW